MFHKVNMTLRPIHSKRRENATRLAVAYSGGASSRLLLEILDNTCIKINTNNNSIREGGEKEIGGGKGGGGKKGGGGRMFFDVSVVFVDERSAFEENSEGRQEREKAFNLVVGECKEKFVDWCLFVVPLSLSFSPPQSPSLLKLLSFFFLSHTSHYSTKKEEGENLEKKEEDTESENYKVKDIENEKYVGESIYNQDERKENENKLKLLLEKVTSLTAKEEILKNLRRNLLLRVSQLINCSNLLIASSGELLVSELISNVCKGKGFISASECHPISVMPPIPFPLPHSSQDLENLEDVGKLENLKELKENCFSVFKREDSLQIVKPLQKLLRKEVYYYVYRRKLKYIQTSSFSSLYLRDKKVREKVKEKGMSVEDLEKRLSIDHLTSSFLLNLHSRFQHTFHTLLRTSSKLVSPIPLSLFHQHFLSFPPPSNSLPSSPSNLPSTFNSTSNLPSTFNSTSNLPSNSTSNLPPNSTSNSTNLPSNSTSNLPFPSTSPKSNTNSQSSASPSKIADSLKMKEVKGKKKRYKLKEKAPPPQKPTQKFLPICPFCLTYFLPSKTFFKCKFF